MMRVEFSGGLAIKQYSNSVPKWSSVDPDLVEEGRLHFYEPLPLPRVDFGGAGADMGGVS